MGKRVAVLMGGWGEEREISIKTGEAVVTALTALGHTAVRVFAGPSLDRAVRQAEADVAFIALHGRMGEDGRVQGLLEVLGLPYTGSGVLASALAMNKPLAKRLFQFQNVPVPTGYVVSDALSEEALRSLHGDLGFPCIVKPACGGSSVGISLVREFSALHPAVEESRRHGGEALVERFVAGRELTVGILGGDVLGSCEIDHGAELFDYSRKYTARVQHHHPPRLSSVRLRNLETLALRAYESLGCRGYGRVDLLASDEGNEVVLEVNTLPGLTAVSLLPEISERAGLPFPSLVDEILSRAQLDPADVRERPVQSDPVPQRIAG